MSMTVSRCFAMCRDGKSGKQLRYFGIENGGRCWCSSLFSGKTLSKRRCDISCVGGSCGGVAGASSVYVMFDCEPPSPEELAVQAEKEQQEILKSFGEVQGSACVQTPTDENVAEIGGRKTMIDAKDTCRHACWNSGECGAFTYEEDMQKCSFHSVVDMANRSSTPGVE